ncbi:MAG: DNA helicase-2/ATP-dependent DNA helicase PcrA [Pirellulaceae bacterium]|jgi:DNA helicase-2/ATP-dependent DNA helicase PcrA
MFDPPSTQSLNESQRLAVEHVDGPLLMLAGPGSGKTRVITNRIARMLSLGIPSSQILALTFTNKAADEMQRRVEKLASGQRVWMGTFHRFCARLLREHGPLVGLKENYSIYDMDDSHKQLKLVIADEEVDLGMVTPERIASEISRVKNRLISPDNYVPAPGNPVGQLTAEIYPLYARRMLQASACDFDDLLLHVATMLREHPELRRALDDRFRYIMVDEYQDTNLAQYTIVRSLSIDWPNLAVTGDPDQSIYGWRGANLNNILNFESDYTDVQVIRLEENYRSTPNILRVADQLISHNTKRKRKDLYTSKPEGKPVMLVGYPHSRDEADTIAARIATDIRSGRRRARDFAIFFRVNALSRQFERALSDEGVPYKIVNGVEFYQRKEIKDVVAYLHLINNPANDMAFMRVINTPPRGIGKTTINRICQFAHEQRIPLLDAARQAGMIDSLNKRAPVAVAKFVSIYDRICILRNAPIEEILGNILYESGYRESLAQSEVEQDHERLANVDELLNDAREFDNGYDAIDRVERFLERVSLVANTDDWESTSDVVTLMTLHSAKGLEFPVVFIIAVEQGMLPHERSLESVTQLEEERRLFFVGITRAEEELQISTASYRDFRGGRRMAVPSEFLMEIPRNEMQCVFPEYGYGYRYGSNDTNDHASQDRYADESYQEPVFKNEGGEENDSFNVAEFESQSEFDGIDEAPDDQELTPASVAARATTATDLFEIGGDDGIDEIAVDPLVFEHDMIVTHPIHGTGKIIALSGRDHKRRATVQFCGEAGQVKFYLAHSPLRPLQT